MLRMRLKLWFLLVLPIGLCRAGASDDLARAALRARLALLRQHTAVAPDRGVAVSGSRSDANALLLEAVQQTRRGIESLLGMSVPLARQQIRVQVLAPALEGGGPVVPSEPTLLVERSGDRLTYRILLPDYESTYSAAAQESLVYALLAAYISDGDGTAMLPVLPAWLWQGVIQILNPDDLEITLVSVDHLWRAGEIPPLAQFLRRTPEERLSETERIIAGGIVYWLAMQPRRSSFFPALFGQIARRQGEIDWDWLGERLGMDPDALWDRWILQQRRTVRGVGGVMQAHIEQLRSVLLLSPGQHGIPQRAAVPRGGALHMLAAHRESDWFASAIRQRRNQLELVAQGRPLRFREIVGEFLGVLDGVVAGQASADLEEQEHLAYLSLALLAQEVAAGGGIWRSQE